MINTSNFYCRQIIDLLSQHGVSTAYCSPGSRNAPLLIGLEACKNIKKYVVVDERSAAFQALGCSLVERTPVMLLCTSGSAVLNYAPAVAEAYYAGIPLIIVSADRPKEWIDQDDSQTIRQYGVLDHIVKGSYDIRAIPEGKHRAFSEDVVWTVNRTVNEAMLKALDGKPGPVHINVQLSDPLGAIEECIPFSQRLVSHLRTKETLPHDVLKSLASEASGAKVMLVAGYSLPDNKLNKAVRMLGTLPNVAIMAETISNLHESQPYSSMIDSVLCEMTEEEKENLRPDIVISIGGALVSRMLKQYLRDYSPRKHWSIGHSNYFCDCFKSLTDRIDIAPEYFIRQLYGAIRKCQLKGVPLYNKSWQQIRVNAAIKSQDYIEKAPWSDLKAYDFILRNLEFDNLFVSNGTSIRYSQLLPHKCHAEYCN
ncbi:MAG: 2-succinyl-5-enolpyruvyl-6-hydroxy-3-cyclohexene-1-carboxylic-acid synthase, partial [Muribaculaceae bacterium]|nr:2-succinyl-5-enolpyruvyl-6-hydroxy-3-cyclohexene-1-carboxylic-acid synthase [Muribaculaceae bacterium]